MGAKGCKKQKKDQPLKNKKNRGSNNYYDDGYNYRLNDQPKKKRFRRKHHDNDYYDGRNKYQNDHYYDDDYYNRQSRMHSRRFSDPCICVDYDDHCFGETAYNFDITPKYYSDIDRLKYYSPDCYPDSYLTRPNTLPITPFEAEELRRKGYIYKPACVPQCVTSSVFLERRCFEI